MASVSADPQAVLQFMQKLATDDAFRAQLERDPANVLAQCGITLSDVPASIKLPPKAHFQDALAKAGVGVSGTSPAGATPASTYYAFLAFFAFMF